MNIRSEREKIRAAAEDQYRKFSASLLPGVSGIQGVRLPVLRKMAAELLKTGGWREWLAEYEALPAGWFEEDLLAGFCIAGADIVPEERLSLVRRFLPRIGNWSVCDSFCISWKEMARNREFYRDFLSECLQSPEEFTVRTGEVLLLDHYCVPEWGAWAAAALKQVTHPGYYARMGQAWALSIFYRMEPELVLPLLKNQQLPAEVCRMTVRKICESRTSTAEERNFLRSLHFAG